MELLFVDLQLTRNQAYKMVADFHLRGLQTQSIQKGLKVYNYIKQKDAQTREALIQSALILIAKISPLEIFCAISTWKRQIKRKGTDKSRTKRK